MRYIRGVEKILILVFKTAGRWRGGAAYRRGEWRGQREEGSKLIQKESAISDEPKIKSEALPDRAVGSESIKLSNK